MSSPSAAEPQPRRARAVGVEQKEARRRQILLAAKGVFAEEGFQATTMADVAKAARLSYGAVYWYFTSKDELFHGLMDLEEEALRTRIAAALEGAAPDDPEVALARAVRATFEFFEEDRAAVKLLFRDSYALGGRFESHLFSIYERFIDDIAGVLAAGQRQGRVIAVPPRVAAFSVAALIGQLAHRRLTTDDGLDASVVADFVVRLVMDGLRPR
ncbi:MAG: TetR/AcrR family transcriptional regulator [Acidimicrobiales bacterium]